MLDRLGVEELTQRWEQARRLIHENGVTYNVYGDPQGMHRPWELDAVPLVIASEEWERLAAALVQRVQVLNALLTDVYGPHKLLSAGLLPPALVFAHPGFLRPCHNVRVPQDCYLHLYAADLARAPDGQWWVLADRTQSPSGAGYALENRLVLSRTLSDVFSEGQVQRLALFFDALRKTLMSLAPYHRDNPRIVLLTPGPYNATYFEHAYLARYLGYTLVEGGDLTVRDTRVFLKTLAGLEPVDVIVRRQDDAFCDAHHMIATGATTTLREHRGDGHVAALVAAGLAGLPMLVLRAALDIGRDQLQPTRGWTWPLAARRVFATARSRLARTFRASSAKTSPAAVGATARLVRSRSRTPSAASSFWIACESGGWAMCRRSAARRKCSSSLTARK